MTLVTLWQRRTYLVNRYADLKRQHRLKQAAMTYAALCEVTRKILKIESRKERKRAA